MREALPLFFAFRWEDTIGNSKYLHKSDGLRTTSSDYLSAIDSS